ncbi:methyltransferase domain-containing protein, partial [Candidatus Gottesmanbacteria bacterium]|nr:methyltransferase domain-containing protein [Candidatus Gottesmanbacteria bacterium]
IKFGRKAERKSKRFYNRLVNKTYKKTVWWQRMEIIEAVPYKAKVLDICCGNGYLAQLIAKSKKAKVTCVDIDNFNQTEIPTILFDGVNLPFEDREFDIVILSYVLHHSEFAEELLSEAARVCRGKVIIYEDETAPHAEEIFAAAHSKIWNFFSDQEGKVIYHSPNEWREIFAQNNLEVLEEKRQWGIGSLAIPLKRAIFVLKSKN